MQRNTKRIIGKGVVCLLCFLLGGVATLGITWHLLGQDGRTLLQAHQLIEKRFVGEYDPAENLSATLETMVDSLGDRWSYYLDRRRPSGPGRPGATPMWASASP